MTFTRFAACVLAGPGAHLFVPQVALAAAQLVVLKNSSGTRLMAIAPHFFFQSLVRTGPGTKANVFVANDPIQVAGKSGQHFRACTQVNIGSDGSIGTVTQLSCHFSGELN